MSDPINLTFLSTAHIHTRSFLDNISEARDGRRVHSIWDDHPERGQKYAASAGTRFVEDLDQAVNDPEVHGFIICAENTRHRPLLEKVIPLGNPVFCEKPLVTADADLEVVQALLQACDTPVFCGYFEPFSGEMRAAARLAREGVLGRITRVRFRNAHHAAYGRWFDNPELAWFHDPELSGGGAFMDMGTHAVHLLRTLFGEVKEVWATIGNEAGIYPAVDDFGIAHLTFGSGIHGTVEAAWTQTGGIGGLEIVGSKKSLWHNRSEYVVAGPKDLPTPLVPDEGSPTRVDRLAALIQGNLHEDEWRRDLQASIDAVRIMNAAYRSASSHKWEKV